MKSQKKLSVVMSAYNEPENFLRESIESILNQTHSDFEFIIIQDKPDNEVIDRVVQEYAAKDKRIRFYKNEKNMGLALSLNRGIALARYDIIARMDADDIALPQLLEKDLAYLNAHPDMHQVSPKIIKIDENGKQIRKSDKRPHTFAQVKRVLKTENIISHPGAMFYKKDIVELGGYRNFPAAQDKDLWLRFVSKDWGIGFVQEVLLKYRLTSQNTSMGNSLRQWACGRYINQLFKKRKKYGKDSFSEEALAKFLDDMGCNDPQSKAAFNRGHDLIFQAGTAFRQFRFLKVARLLKEAYACHPQMKPHTRFMMQVAIRKRIRNIIY